MLSWSCHWCAGGCWHLGWSLDRWVFCLAYSFYDRSHGVFEESIHCIIDIVVAFLHAQIQRPSPFSFDLDRLTRSNILALDSSTCVIAQTWKIWSEVGWGAAIMAGETVRGLNMGSGKHEKTEPATVAGSGRRCEGCREVTGIVTSFSRLFDGQRRILNY